jgi:ABC-type uncharacterized transport system involved in gliding motility auxiliary subunit
MARVGDVRTRLGKPWPVLPVGLLLVLAGALLSSMAGVGTYLPRLLLLGGGAVLVWGLIRGFPTLRLFMSRMRKVAEPGPSLTWLLLGGVLLVASVGLDLQKARFALTARGLQSLSQSSRQALARLPGQVEMIGVYRESAPEHEMAKDVLDIYRTQVRGVRTRMLDPDRQPDEARRLGINFQGAVLVKADSVREVVSDLTEAALTQAILRVGNPQRPVVALLDGHGEMAPGRSGLSQLWRILTEGGFTVRKLRLGEVGEVPADVRVLLEVGPSSTVLPGEIGAISRFLDRGGRLGVFLDPSVQSGLASVLAPRGIRIDGRRVVDDGPLTRSVGLGPETIAVQSLGDHPAARGLTAAIVLREATSVGLASRAVWGVNGTEILRSAPSARLVGEPLDPDPEALPANRGNGLPLGAALEWAVPGETKGEARAAAAQSDPAEKPTARLVVVGDSNFLRDDTIDLYGNREFATRLAGWLGEREFLLNFKPIDQSGTPLRVGLRGIRTIFYLVELLLPLGVLVFGVLVWMRRR